MGRARKHRVEFCLDDYEYEVLQRNFKASGCNSMRDYIFEMCRRGYILNVNYDGLKNVSYELNAIGTNINQIAHRANADGYNNAMLLALSNQCREMQKIVAFAFRKY
ncbi:MAG: MobC family plasmid mobilization relaxosome protein [Lachnospiraceae bacterium]|nr:MobC family plasmid mobilization relaxosome protein [Lachnospiraceae bacterium]